MQSEIVKPGFQKTWYFGCGDDFLCVWNKWRRHESYPQKLLIWLACLVVHCSPKWFPKKGLLLQNHSGKQCEAACRSKILFRGKDWNCARDSCGELDALSTELKSAPALISQTEKNRIDWSLMRISNDFHVFWALVTYSGLLWLVSRISRENSGITSTFRIRQVIYFRLLVIINPDYLNYWWI